MAEALLPPHGNSFLARIPRDFIDLCDLVGEHILDLGAGERRRQENAGLARLAVHVRDRKIFLGRKRFRWIEHAAAATGETIASTAAAALGNAVGIGQRQQATRGLRLRWLAPAPGKIADLPR